MLLNRYTSKSRIIDLVSNDFEEALLELLDVCRLSEVNFNKDLLLKELIDRETTMTTFLGEGIALPHLRIPMKRPYLFAIGRCTNGLEFDGHEEYRDLRIIFLLLASEKEKSYLNVLASLARTFQDRSIVSKLTSSKNIQDLRTALHLTLGGAGELKRSKDNKFNRLILREAQKIARGAKASSLLVFADTFAGGIDFGNEFGDFKTLLVTQKVPDAIQRKNIHAVIPVRSYSNNRLSQLRSAVIIGLSRGVIRYNDRLCCIGGLPQSNQFDTLVVVDVEREFQSVFTRQTDMLPANVKPEVLERVLAIATELSVEGREGRSVGCLFVLGDASTFKSYMKQLVLNPFLGYQAEERNILNPFMDETVKEFSSLDGAFVVQGDGVLESAGTLIHAPAYNQQLPSGLGSRHAAAVAISIAADCISIVVSASTGQVTLFRRGQMLPLMEKGIGREH